MSCIRLGFMLIWSQARHAQDTPKTLPLSEELHPPEHLQALLRCITLCIERHYECVCGMLCYMVSSALQVRTLPHSVLLIADCNPQSCMLPWQTRQLSRATGHRCLMQTTAHFLRASAVCKCPCSFEIMANQITYAPGCC